MSTKGENDEEVSEELSKFLRFVQADLTESSGDFQDEYVEQLQKSIQNIKESREMEERFMLFQELLNDERTEGRAEGRAEGRESMLRVLVRILETKGVIPEELMKRLVEEEDMDSLGNWIEVAAEIESIDQFLEEM